MSTRIIGLDLSLVSSGVALPDGTTTTIRPRHVDPRGRRLNDLGSQLWPHLDHHRPHVAIIEGYALHAPGMLGALRRAEWVGCVLRDLRRLRVPVVEVDNAKLKSYGTGHGGADKDRMVAAAIAAGATPANDDEADAYLLRAFGLLVVDGIDLFNQPEDVPRRLRLADTLWWPTSEELAHAG